ncbi:hypothetical protein DVR12_21025 [Chitinophaga silvatica]|uniref:Response regulatory domain-containing protein n=1 Tax=Chitinophaga silvatica TaxID=2282649 RepID=A0A3E1Y648_9BACT|nr:hypothetical protein [Chitinophaga silvatica]RFS20201.1 hypothetical protein DVR12_21025 [Chitinophaga silvatica]
MNEKIACLLIDADRDRRNQFFMALDLLGNSKACICQDNLESAIEYLKTHQDSFTPDYIFLDAEANQTTLVPSFPSALKTNVPVIWYSGSYHSSCEISLKQEGWAAGLTKQSNLLQLKANLKTLFGQDLSIKVLNPSKPILRLVKYEPTYEQVPVSVNS